MNLITNYITSEFLSLSCTAEYSALGSSNKPLLSPYGLFPLRSREIRFHNHLQLATVQYLLTSRIRHKLARSSIIIRTPVVLDEPPLVVWTLELWVVSVLLVRSFSDQSWSPDELLRLLLAPWLETMMSWWPKVASEAFENTSMISVIASYYLRLKWCENQLLNLHNRYTTVYFQALSILK